MSILVVDVGTSGVRSALVQPDATVGPVAHRQVLPVTPAAGFVEMDAVAVAEAVLAVAHEALAAAGPGAAVEAVGVANQRATTVVWDRGTGRPIGPGIGWQDLRTVGTCLMLQAQGLHLAPNASATKVAYLLDTYDPARERDLAFGTVDSWVAWTLTGGAAHVTDATNAGLTGLVDPELRGWDPAVLEALRIPEGLLPRIVDSTGVVAECTALPGAPPLAGIAGDQQASLMGQACVDPGQAKATFGTGGMLDCVTGPRPGFAARGPGGCFPVVARRAGGRDTWGVEAVMLSAGSAVEWLRDDLGVVASAADSAAVAGACRDTGGVWFVPALLGLGTPRWDYGARGTVLGLTRGSGRAELVRAVLEGVAHRGADLLEAAQADAGVDVARLRVDGGMSANGVFVQALADACQRPIELSPVLEATTLGAAYLAGLAVGTWAGLADVAASWRPSTVVEPRTRTDRDRWRRAVERAAGWVPELSALDL